MKRILLAMAMMAALIHLTPATAQAQDDDGFAGLIADINPGPGHGSPIRITAISETTAVLIGDDGSGTGGELWVTDGTAAGTELVKDIWPGATSSDIGPITALNGKALFRADDGASGQELWISDGTTAGTNLLKNFAVGDGAPRSMIAIGDRVYFSATDPSGGRELYATDGTSGGTVRVKDINPGPTGSNPVEIVSYGSDHFVFTADDGTTGPEPWISDGTAGGTVLIADVNPGSDGSSSNGFTVSDNEVFFSADDGVHGQEPWSTFGKPTNTEMLHDVWPGPDGSAPLGFTELGGPVVFTADDGTHGPELWRHDLGYTDLVLDIRPGSQGSLIGIPSSQLGDVAIFPANNGTTGLELWRSDGTATGTWLIKDVVPGAGDHSPGFATSIGGRLLYQGTLNFGGREPFSTDGTSADTAVVRNISLFGHSNPAGFARLGDKILFTATGDMGQELYGFDFVPGPPIRLGATGLEGGRSVVSWEKPDSSPTTSYTVVATPSGNSCTTTGSQCAVTGLAGGIRYEFSVTSANSNGVSKAATIGAVVGPLAIDLPAGSPCAGLIPTHVGTNGDDEIYATNGHDVIFGYDGNDQIWGRQGDDIICAGAGNDRVFAGSGRNELYGEAGVDKMRAGGDRDALSGGDDRDFLKGGHGDDFIRGDRGSDRIRGSVGNDEIHGGPDNDVLWGGPGDDVLFGNSGDDILKGSAGTDYCHGGAGVDQAKPDCTTVVGVP